MPKELVCPHCGVCLSPDDDSCEITAPLPSPDPAQTIEEMIPATMSLTDHPLDPSLNAAFALATPPAEPDEVGKFVTGDSITAPEPSRNGTHETDPPIPIPPPSTPEPTSETVEPAFPLNIAAEAPALTPAETLPAIEEIEVSRPGMGFILLASYASAMTIACLWLVWQARHRDAAGPDTLPVDSRPDDRSGRLSVIPENRTTTLGKPLRIGDLTLTPIRAALGQVTLEAAKPNGDGEKKQGAEGSVLLTLSIQNHSEDTSFAPLELAFLRTPDTGSPASFIETKSGTIDLYPLAESSEWRIVGQEVRDLKPGETMQTLIAGEPTASRNLDGTLRLRLQLHPTADTTNVVHIDIDGDSLQ